MNIFLDTEFTKLPWEKDSQLLSIALVKEDGQSYFACLSDIDTNNVSVFVKLNVLPYLPKPELRKTRSTIVKELINFLKEDQINIWALFPTKEQLLKFGIGEENVDEIYNKYADFDFQLFKRLWDSESFPKNIKSTCENLAELISVIPKENLPENNQQHNPLSDTLWNLEVWKVYNKAISKNPNMKIEIIPGKEVTQLDLDLINKYRKIRLDRTSVWNHETNNGFEERTFFLVKDNNQLMSFGTLKPIKLYVDKNEFEILGIQAVVSIVQGKGYGKILLEAIINFVNKSGKTMIGFCNTKNSEFYRKCGCKIFEDGYKYFIYVDNKGERLLGDPGDIFYINGKDNFMDKVAKNKIEVSHYVPQW